MLTKEYLYQKYVVEGLSIRQVAADASVNDSVVRKWLKFYDIPRRTKSEALSGERNPMFGKVRPDDVRRRISETLCQTSQDPEVKAKRRNAVLGPKNPMFGKTHTLEVRQASRVRLEETRKELSYKAAHLNAMQRPEVRQALSEAASKRIGSLNTFYGREHSEETKQRISEANSGRFRGSKGPNWQGGKTPLALLIRNSERYVAWRRSVFDRDKFTCQGCRRVGGPLHADHIKPFAVLLREHNLRTLEDAYGCAELWDISNGRTLCVPCHKRTPSFAGNFQKNYKP